MSPIIGPITASGARSIYGKFSAIIKPHSGVGGFAPSPMKLSEVKLRVMTGNLNNACLSSGGNT